MTESAEIIDILNACGHCASSNTIIRHETVLATLCSSEDSIVPGDLVKKEPTILVLDHQDYNEETKTLQLA